MIELMWGCIGLMVVDILGYALNLYGTKVLWTIMKVLAVVWFGLALVSLSA